MWYGVDINNENIADNFQAFVWEPAMVRINALTAASEAACGRREAASEPCCTQVSLGGGLLKCGCTALLSTHL